jgi:hypothetical protein
MLPVKKIYSIILVAGIMFGLSFLWHKFVLNDFARPDFDMDSYYLFAPLIYIILSFLIAFVIATDIMRLFIDNGLISGFFSGAICGLIIYFILLLSGVSYSKNLTTLNIITDIGWQIVEQGTGGIVLKLLYRTLNNED